AQTEGCATFSRKFTMKEITRRDFIATSGAPLVATALSQPLFATWSGVAAPQSKMGIASTSFSGAEIGSGPPPQGAANRRCARDAYEYLEKCYALGAGGIQTQLNGDLSKLRARAEQLGMYIEGMVAIPRNGDMGQLERGLLDAKAAGATVVRAAMLGG